VLICPNMKYIITESQLNSKVYNKFLNMLVDKTEIFGGMYYEYNKYEYAAHIKYPYADNPYSLSFNNPESFTFTSPGRYNLKDWFLFIGIDMDESPKLCEELWNDYLDKLQVKIQDYIREYIDRKWE